VQSIIARWLEKQTWIAQRAQQNALLLSKAFFNEAFDYKSTESITA
jgi:hypothetical protein